MKYELSKLDIIVGTMKITNPIEWEQIEDYRLKAEKWEKLAESKKVFYKNRSKRVMRRVEKDPVYKKKLKEMLKKYRSKSVPEEDQTKEI